jgi:phage shock protein PspC (stress-responsive transcriptional regulator)
MRKRLYRSDDQMVAGVCAGIAEYFGWEKSVVRIGYLLLSVFSAAFPGILVYIIMWIIMPENKGRTIYM